MKPIALTSGDPNGIGPEITLRAAREIRAANGFVIGDPAHYDRIKDILNLNLRITPFDHPIAELRPSDANELMIRPLFKGARQEFGKPDPKHAKTILQSIDLATHFCLSGEACAIVTNPISKYVLKTGADFPFPGHTEYLEEKTGAQKTVMMLVGPGLRVVPATIHIPLSDVPNLLTSSLLEEVISITHRELITKFQIDNPRIAVAGLNPHAGENGVIGHEEKTWIKPLIDKMSQSGLMITGPHPADTLFHPLAREGYDAAICMYHDQALAPLKALFFDEGVNVTLGLPIVRTSPDHGTGFDIAAKGKANPKSLISALHMAQHLSMQGHG